MASSMILVDHNKMSLQCTLVLDSPNFYLLTHVRGSCSGFSGRVTSTVSVVLFPLPYIS